MKHHLALWICILYPGYLFADQNVNVDLENAKQMIQKKSYDNVIESVNALIEEMKLNTLESIADAHKYLALSYCETFEHSKAKEHMKTLTVFDDQATFEGLDVSLRCRQDLATFSEKEKISGGSQTQKTSSSSTKTSPRSNLPHRAYLLHR
ncbi:MAG: hypothetical protein R3A11_05410 [Bdellovibrionota bacterium]